MTYLSRCSGYLEDLLLVNAILERRSHDRSEKPVEVTNIYIIQHRDQAELLNNILKSYFQ